MRGGSWADVLGGVPVPETGSPALPGDPGFGDPTTRDRLINATAQEAHDKAKQDDINEAARKLIPPDLTDKAVQEARARAARQLTLGQGRRSTFLTGPGGVTAPKPLAYKSLFGGGV
jgi:hypothetical protein